MPINIQIKIEEGEDGFVYTSMHSPAADQTTPKEERVGRVFIAILSHASDDLAKQQGINVRKSSRKKG